MIKKAFLLMFHKLRLSQPWNYKAPGLLCLPYTFFYATHASLLSALTAIAWSLCTGIGVAGLGYFINDLADRDSDRAAGIINGAEGLSRRKISFVLSFFAIAFALPWVIYFPVNPLLAALLLAQVLLYLAYSTPPLRLKDRGLAGLLADAAYAHAIPALIGAYTFFLITGRSYTNFHAYCWTLVAWQLIFGFRSILQHQIADSRHDKAAGSTTFVLAVGELRARRLVSSVLVPLEATAFLLHTVVLSAVFPAFFALWPLYVLIILLTQQPWLYTFFDYYYLRWLPLILLSYLCARNPGMIPLLILHLILFNNGLTPLFKLWSAATPSS
jgi:4-hydroxybenzoate polyprenyltransferase